MFVLLVEEFVISILVVNDSKLFNNGNSVIVVNNVLVSVFIKDN